MAVDMEGQTVGKTRRADGRPPVNVMLDCNAEAIKARFLAGLIDPN